MGKWNPFYIDAAYDGGYVVKRQDGFKHAVFVAESEARFFCDKANERCREIEHTGFGDDYCTE